MVYYIKDGELYHHGIKGQRWGVRRFQKKDGSLTSAGKNRYKKKSLHRIRLEEKYMKKGMSKAEAEKAADKRIKVETAIGITAGVTVTACAAYYARNKWVENHCDQILSKGTTFHNLDGTANPRPGEHLYVNYRQNDKAFFRGQFALNKIKQTGHVYDHVVEAQEDIKIPSVNNRKAVFKQLYDSDESFRNAINQHSGVGNINDSKLAYKQMWSRFGDKDTPEFNTAKSKYFEALRQKGYEAIVDEWDTNPLVYRSDAPLILLNNSSKSFGEMSIKELTAKEVLTAQANSRNYSAIRSAKTALGIPHTNHFKESAKTLSRHAKKNLENESYISKILKEAGKDDAEATKEALRYKGRVLADAGKYMTKNEKMTVDKAMKLAKTKDTVRKTAEGSAYTVAAIGALEAPSLILTKAQTDKQIRKYLREHPNTKMTTSEIEKRIREGRI